MEIANVGINDNRNDINNAILPFRGVVTLFIVADAIEVAGSDDEIEGTRKNLSAVEIASGLDNIVPVDTDDGGAIDNIVDCEEEEEDVC